MKTAASVAEIDFLTMSIIDGNGPTSRDFSGKYIGLFFSASWCPPCRDFTPKLVEYYTARTASGAGDFEIIFCSSDQNQDQHDEYYGVMPWLKLRYQDPDIKRLSLLYDVEAVPTLVIVDSQGHLVNRHARKCIENDPTGIRFPYYPEPVQSLCDGVDSYGYDMNTKPSLVVLMENCSPDEHTSAMSVLTAFGNTLAKDKISEPTGPEMLFFFASISSENSARVRVLCRLPRAEVDESPARMVILDVPDAGAYYLAEHTAAEGPLVTEGSVLRFIEGFRARSLTKRKLR